MTPFAADTQMQSTLAARVLALRARLGISQEELARWLGVSRSYVNHVEKGRSCSSPVLKLIERLENEVHRPAAAPPPPVAPPSALPPASLRPKMQAVDMPLLTMQQVASLPSPETAARHASQLFTCTVADQQAFAVQIRTDEMSPQHQKGDLAIVYPSLRVQEGDRVLACLSSDGASTALFRIYHSSDQGRRVILSSPNPAYTPLHYARADFNWLHPVGLTLRHLRDETL